MEHFYLIDLFKNLARRKNLCALLYLIINILFVCFVFLLLSAAMLDQPKFSAALIGIVIYLIVTFAVISPLGEWIMRYRNGCKKIEDTTVLNRLEPLFNEVKGRAMEKHPDLSVDPGVTLYIQEDASANAFALGRRTVCVTTGLLACDDEEIKGIFAHEFGHLATHDTDLSLLVAIGNFIVVAIAAIFRFIIALYKAIFSLFGMLLGGAEGIFLRAITWTATFLTNISSTALLSGWTKLGVLLVMKTSRDAEFEADAFACDLGYTDGLMSFFNGLLVEEHKLIGDRRTSAFSALASSHPKTEKRIASILERSGNTVQ